MPCEFLKKVPGVNTDQIKYLTSKKGKSLGLRTIVDICRTETDILA